LMTDLYGTFKSFLYDIENFTRNTSGVWLRRYQVEAARAICRSVIQELGHSFAIVFPRQSGKNECQAQIEAFLLTMFSPLPAEIVKVSPTMKPQTLNAMSRLQRLLEGNLMVGSRWKKEGDHVFRLGNARITFLSGFPTSNVVGATANLLLECDEAQEVAIEKWDKDFAPMAASTNATRVFWGTAWTSETLLAREMRLARQAEREDGVRRLFIMDASQVAAEVPEYGKFVSLQASRLGRQHPLVRTQYYSEEIDSAAGMFPPERRALMSGGHSPSIAPLPGRLYAILIDVAGEDESASDLPRLDVQGGDGAASDLLANPARDATALTVVEVDLSTLEDELLQAPTYRVVCRKQWVGVRHSQLYGRVKALAQHWGARYLIIDATGVGAGLASFLEKALPGVVVPFTFTAASKSDLGWAFLSIVETGRYKDFSPLPPLPFRGRVPRYEGGVGGEVVGGEPVGGEVVPGEVVAGEPVGDDITVAAIEDSALAAQVRLQESFFTQVELCQSKILEGPGKLMQWGVPAGRRHPLTRRLVHDDLLVSASFCAVLDRLEWGLGRSTVIDPADIFSDMHPVY
jgi:hypothetical protein